MELGQVLETYGVIGLLVVIAGQFVLTQMMAQRARVQMERAAEDRLESRHQALMKMMNERLAEAKAETAELTGQIGAARARIATLEEESRTADRQIDELKIALEVARRDLAEARMRAAQLPEMTNKLNLLQEQMKIVRAALAEEKKLRDSAEKRVQNLEMWNTRATADNAMLLQKVNELNRQNKKQAEQIVVLEQALIQLGKAQEQARANDGRTYDALAASSTDGAVSGADGGDLQRERNTRADGGVADGDQQPAREDASNLPDRRREAERHEDDEKFGNVAGGGDDAGGAGGDTSAGPDERG